MTIAREMAKADANIFGRGFLMRNESGEETRLPPQLVEIVENNVPKSTEIKLREPLYLTRGLDAVGKDSDFYQLWTERPEYKDERGFLGETEIAQISASIIRPSLKGGQLLKIESITVSADGFVTIK